MIVGRLETRDLSEPEAVVTYALGATSQVRLAGTVVSHHVLQPGWRWETHAQAEAGTASCELHHRGVVLRGRMGVRTDDGEEAVIGPNQVFDLVGCVNSVVADLQGNPGSGGDGQRLRCATSTSAKPHDQKGPRFLRGSASRRRFA